MLSDKPWFQEGLRRYAAGEKLQFSTGIDGRMSWGYGRLDFNGFFEHPVPFEDLDKKTQDFIMEMDGGGPLGN